MARKRRNPGTSQFVSRPSSNGGTVPTTGEKTPMQTGPYGTYRGSVDAGGVGAAIGIESPVLPEQTGPGYEQSKFYNINMTGINGGRANAQTPGLPPAPLGSYQVYRWINMDPTIAIARATVHGPILGSPWSYTKKEPDVPDEWRDFIQSVYDPIQAGLKTQLLRALDFGHRSFEQIYGMVPFNNKQYIGVTKFKPLRPERTQVLVDPDTGGYVGLRNGGVELDGNETLHFAYDVEDDDWYGRSRHENVREDAWWPSLFMEQAGARLARKVTNIIPVIKGPISQVEVDRNGKEISGFEAGMLVLDGLTYGDGVLVENLVAAADDIAANPALAKASKWDISSFDTGNSRGASIGILDFLRYYDALKLRGWLRPERTATQGQVGTSAEVPEQADVGLAEGEQIHLLMAQLLNKRSVDRLLVWNFGEQARGMVFIEPAPLINEKKAVFRWIWQQLLANPGIVDLLASKMDLDAMADQLGIPRINQINVDSKKLMTTGAGAAGMRGTGGSVQAPTLPSYEDPNKAVPRLAGSDIVTGKLSKAMRDARIRIQRRRKNARTRKAA